MRVAVQDREFGAEEVLKMLRELVLRYILGYSVARLLARNGRHDIRRLLVRAIGS